MDQDTDRAAQRVAEVARSLKRSQRPERPGASVRGDKATIIGPTDRLPNSDDLMRSRGFDPDEWEVVSATVNEWDGPIRGGGARVLRQLKIHLRKKVSLQMLSPAAHVPRLRKIRRSAIRERETGSQLVVVEGDHQAPYHDIGLHEASLKFLRDYQPDRHIFLGDTLDFPTISRHPDNAVFNATPQEVVQVGYELLREKREAAPNATAVKLCGNHDWRISSEQLLRAERLHGLKPAQRGDKPEIDAFSIRRLLHLDQLGVEFVCPPQGWEHGEVELTDELVVRHGWLTGQKTPKKSLDTLGRSLIVGHTHHKEHLWQLHYGGKVPRIKQAVIAGTMSRLDLPYVVNPDWHQGFVTVNIFPNGRFVIEHATWEDGALYWRDRMYVP